MQPHFVEPEDVDDVIDEAAEAELDAEGLADIEAGRVVSGEDRPSVFRLAGRSRSAPMRMSRGPSKRKEKQRSGV